MTKSRKTIALNSKIDVAIIGGGPAGISALLWARKLGLKSLLIDRETRLGGQLNSIYNQIADYPGRTARNGADMLRHFIKSLGDAHDSLLLGTAAEKIDVQNLEINLSPEGSIASKAIVLAMGVRRRRLNIPGEKEFEGKGLLISGAKQRGSVRGEFVAIVGGGDAAFENALILAESAQRVYLIHRREQFSARPEFVSRVHSDRRIELITDSFITRIEGDDRLRSVIVKERSGGAKREIRIDALLIRIGIEPNSELVKRQVKLDRSGYVIVDSHCQTSCPNIFAVGDIANPGSPTIATSVGTGAIAAQIIAKELRKYRL